MATAEEQAEVRFTREGEKHELEIRRLKSELSLMNSVVKLAIPVFLAGIAAVQVYNAWVDHDARKAKDLSDDLAAASRMDHEWVRLIHQLDKELKSKNPAEMCHATKLLKHAAPNGPHGKDEYFKQNVGMLLSDSQLCWNDAERNLAIAQFKEGQWGKYRLGAKSPYIRMDPSSGERYAYVCPVAAIGQAGKRDGVCSLPLEHRDGRIYRVDYVCSDPKCGWSYGSAIGSYEKVVENIDSTSIRWRRIWDGDAHDEQYVLYFEKAQKGDAPAG